MTRARFGSLALVRAVPVRAWLTGIVAVSTLVRFLVARHVVAPWIMEDEIIYSELGKSFAATGHFLVRGSPSGFYGVVYPILIAPAFRIFPSIPSAYEAVKAINSLLMSLTAVPVYFLARRVLPKAHSVAVATLSIAIPSMAYTSTLMTENAFYPAFALVALGLVLMLERPTPPRQLAVLGLCALAYLTRTQAIAFFPAVLTAPLLLAWIDPRRRRLQDYRLLWGIAAASLVLPPIAQLARGGSIMALLGAYAPAGRLNYSISAVLKWLAYHVAELDLFLGVIPFAAMLLVVARSRQMPPRTQAFIAASTALSVWLLVEVAAFASRIPIPRRVEERNLFYVAPLFLIALLICVEKGVSARRLAPWCAAAVSAALPAILPYSSLIGPPAASDELALSIWWRLQDNTISSDHIAIWAVICSLAAALLFVLLPQHLAWLLPVTVVAVFIAVGWTAMDFVHGFRRASLGALFQGITDPHRDWIDRAVGREANVAVLWTTCVARDCAEPSSLTDEKVLWENEFFSRSVGSVYFLHDRVRGGLPQHPAGFRPETGFFTSNGKPIRAHYALVDSSVEPVGKLVAADTRKGVSVYRLDGPLRQAEWVRGVYPDNWSGPRIEYVRRGCTGGLLVATLQGDASLFKTPSHVVVRSRGKVVQRATVSQLAPRLLRVPLVPRNGVCEATLSVSPTKVPRSRDTRRLGIRVPSLVYQPQAR